MVACFNLSIQIIALLLSFSQMPTLEKVKKGKAELSENAIFVVYQGMSCSSCAKFIDKIIKNDLNRTYKYYTVITDRDRKAIERRMAISTFKERTGNSDDFLFPEDNELFLKYFNLEPEYNNFPCIVLKIKDKLELIKYEEMFGNEAYNENQIKTFLMKLK